MITAGRAARPAMPGESQGMQAVRSCACRSPNDVSRTVRLPFLRQAGSLLEARHVFRSRPLGIFYQVELHAVALRK